MSDILWDLVVVLPGILGSTLAKDGKLVWAPSVGPVMRAISTFAQSIRELQLPEGIGDEHPHDGVEPIDVMPDLHVLPGLWIANIGYGALLKWLRTRFHLIEAPLDDPDRFANLLPVAHEDGLSRGIRDVAVCRALRYSPRRRVSRSWLCSSS